MGPDGVRYLLGLSRQSGKYSLTRIEGETRTEKSANLNIFGTPLAVAEQAGAIALIDATKTLLVLRGLLISEETASLWEKALECSS